MKKQTLLCSCICHWYIMPDRTIYNFIERFDYFLVSFQINVVILWMSKREYGWSQAISQAYFLNRIRPASNQTDTQRARAHTHTHTHTKKKKHSHNSHIRTNTDFIHTHPQTHNGYIHPNVFYHLPPIRSSLSHTHSAINPIVNCLIDWLVDWSMNLSRNWLISWYFIRDHP